MQAWCCGRNFATRPCHGVAASDAAHLDQTSHEVHFGESFKGKLVPFGSRIFWKCLNPDLIKEAAKFEEPTRDGIFLGNRVHSGCRWSGDYLVMDTVTYAN